MDGGEVVSRYQLVGSGEAFLASIFSAISSRCTGTFWCVDPESDLVTSYFYDGDLNVIGNDN